MDNSLAPPMLLLRGNGESTMRSTFAAFAVCVLGLTGCKPASQAASPPGVAAQAAVQPSRTMAETFSGCQWGRVENGALAIWSYACPADKGGMRLVADDTLPGFSIESTAGGEPIRQPAIIAFKKAADAPVTAILDAVRVKSPGSHTDTCELVSAAGRTPEPGLAFILAPTGAVKAAWDRQDAGEGAGEPMDPPCGPLGVQMSGDRSFRQLAGDPTTVVFIEYGSEIQIFDPATLTSKAEH